MAVYKITSKYASKCLNIVGDSVTTLANNDDLCLWEDSGTNEQKWEISSLNSSTYVKSVIDTSYGLNANRYQNPWECDLYRISGNEKDAAVTFVGSGGYYKIRLTNYPTYYLTAGGTTNYSSVYWSTASGGDNQLWSVEDVDDNTNSDSTLGQPVSSYSDFEDLSEIDVVARCIYSEACGESYTGKCAVASVIRNRKNKNMAEFKYDNYKEVVLDPGMFSGMSDPSPLALTPDTNDSNWSDCVEIAENIGTISNPIRNCLWFRTNIRYTQSVYWEDDVKMINMSGGGRAITDEIVIGGHTFYLVEGY